MKILRTVVMVCALSVVFSVAVAARVAHADAPRLPQGTLHGSVFLHGANIAPSDIKIRLRSLLQNNLGPPESAAVRLARIAAVPGESNALQFTIPNVVIGLPYRLGIQFHNTSVGKVVWRVTNGGMVRLLSDTAAREPFRVDGYVVTSEMEILRSQARGNADLWVGADNLDFTDPATAIRTLRWRTSLPGVSKGRLQILTERPTIPSSGHPPNPCDAAGLIYAVDFDVQRNGWATLPPIDFHSIILGTSSGEAVLPGVDPKTQLQLQMGAGLYVRAIPLDSDGAPVCNAEQSGLPGMVIVAKPQSLFVTPSTGPEKVELHWANYEPPTVDEHHPKSDETCYRITQDHFVYPITIDDSYDWVKGFNQFFNFYDYMLYWSSPPPFAPNVGQLYGEGYRFCWANHTGDSSYLEDFSEAIGDIVTGYLDALGGLVNTLSKLWSDLQKAVVGVAAGAINKLHIINCDPNSKCEKDLEYGLKIGLAAMGVPPNLPNADQAMHAGAEYLAEVAAEQVGVPGVDVAATQVANNAVDFIQKVAQDLKAGQGTPGLPDWLRYDIRLDPAVLTLHLDYDEISNFPTLAQPLLRGFNNPIFLGWDTPLPRRNPQSPGSLAIPITLWPNTQNLPPPPSCLSYGYYIDINGSPVKYCVQTPSDYDKALWNKSHWIKERLHNGCAQFDEVVWDSSGAYNLFSANVAAEFSAVFPPNHFSNCSP